MMPLPACSNAKDRWRSGEREEAWPPSMKLKNYKKIQTSLSRITVFVNRIYFFLAFLTFYYISLLL